MTPIRIGASWARTSLPPRLSAAIAAAQFPSSDLREVIVFMGDLPMSFLRSMDAMPQRFRAVFGYRPLESTGPSHLPANESGLHNPKSDAHPLDEVSFADALAPLF